MTNQSTIEAVAALLETHGAAAVLEALSDAADACSDVGSANDERRFKRAASLLRQANIFTRTAESLSGITLAMGAEVLANCAQDEVAS